MRLLPVRAPTLCVVAVVVAACGGAAQSVHPATTRSAAPDRLTHVVRAGRLAFTLPSSWAVGQGVCRCGWGVPDTATLDNGPQGGGVVCYCPAESGTAPSGLHLYEGSTGLLPGGRPTVIDGVRALVTVDASTAMMTASFPAVDQWISISPAPAPGTRSVRSRQAALERKILATVRVDPDGSGAP